MNDGSTDATGELADRLALRDKRVEVMHDPPLRDGWLGKANAMQCAFERATAEEVLFTDADVIHRPGALARGLAERERSGADLLSLSPRFHFECWWENVLLPHATMAGVIRFLARGREPAAVGAFMLVRRQVLEEMGGLACVKHEMLDDVMLAREVKRRGFQAAFALAPDLLDVRLFNTNREAFWGLTKNVLAGLRSPWQAVPLAIYVVLVYGLPPLAILVGTLRWDWGLFVSGLGVYAVQFSLVTLLRPLARVRWSQAWAFPLAMIPLLCCLVAALYYRVRHQGVYWRGRVRPVQ